jgi:4-hydroxybenzoate polyprenyltransferase
MSFLLKSHLFISICVAAFTIQTYWVFSNLDGLKITPVLINFIGTFVVYNLQKLVDSTKDEFLVFEKYNWYNKYRKLLLTLMFLFVFISVPTIYSFFKNNSNYFWLYLIGVLGAFVYYFKPIKLRRVGWYKPIHIALIYIFCGGVIPLNAYLNEKIIFYLSSQFILIYCLCLIYDLKDFNQDKAINLKTIATRLNLKTFKIIGVSLLLLHVFLVLFTRDLSLIYSSMCVALYLITFILLLNYNLKYILYLLFVDGVLVLQFLLIIIFSNYA